MRKLIKPLIRNFFKYKTRKYEFTIHALNEFNELPPNARKLIIKLLTRSDSGTKNIMISGGYKDFDFDHPPAFYKARSILIDKQFIVYEDNKYFMNPNMINYFNRRQWHTLKSIAGMIKETRINFGVIPPPKKK